MREVESPDVANAAGRVLDADSTEVLDRFQSVLDLVNVIARQLARKIGPHVELEELVSAGREGLLDAARRYDPARGVPFKAYANYRVRGAMIDGIRKMSALPRRAYERLAALEASSLVCEGDAVNTFARTGARAGRGVTETMVDEHVSTMATAAAVAVLTRARRWPADDAREIPADSNPEKELERAELLALVRRSLTDLSPDEAEIIRRHYFEGHPMEDIAAALDITASWARRLHTRGMALLAKRLNRE